MSTASKIVLLRGRGKYPNCEQLMKIFRFGISSLTSPDRWPVSEQLYYCSWNVYFENNMKTGKPFKKGNFKTETRIQFETLFPARYTRLFQECRFEVILVGYLDIYLHSNSDNQ